MRWPLGIVRAIPTDVLGGQSAKGAEAFKFDASGQKISESQQGIGMILFVVLGATETRGISTAPLHNHGLAGQLTKEGNAETPAIVHRIVLAAYNWGIVARRVLLESRI